MLQKTNKLTLIQTQSKANSTGRTKTCFKKASLSDSWLKKKDDNKK